MVAGFHTTPRTLWWTIPAGSLLLAGLALTAGKFRRRRHAALRPGERLAAPSSTVAGTELAAIERSAGSRISTLRGLLQSLTPYVRDADDPPPVRAVQVGEDRIEVLFAEPAAEPPPGWTSVDGGRSWTHRFEAEASESRQLLTPALVTIGVRSGERAEEVLLDLETAGTVAITGERNAALGLARSIVLELATYPLGVAMDVGLIGLTVEGAELCDRTWVDTSLERAVRVCRQRAEAYAAPGGVVAARAQLDEDDGAHDPQVFVIDCSSIPDDDLSLLDELISACKPSSGSAVVLIGDHPDARERIDIVDGRAIWSGVDVMLHAPAVSLEAAHEAASLLDHAANAECVEVGFEAPGRFVERRRRRRG